MAKFLSIKTMKVVDWQELKDLFKRKYGRNPELDYIFGCDFINGCYIEFNMDDILYELADGGREEDDDEVLLAKLLMEEGIYPSEYSILVNIWW